MFFFANTPLPAGSTLPTSSLLPANFLDIQKRLPLKKSQLFYDFMTKLLHTLYKFYDFDQFSPILYENLLIPCVYLISIRI